MCIFRGDTAISRPQVIAASIGYANIDALHSRFPSRQLSLFLVFRLEESLRGGKGIRASSATIEGGVERVIAQRGESDDCKHFSNPVE
jgi:hypothetical protein